VSDGDILVLTGGHQSFSAATAVLSNLPRLAFSASNVLYSSGTVVLSGVGGGATVNTGAGTIQVSVAAQTNQSMGYFVISQSTGASSSTSRDARSISFGGYGGVSIGFSNGTIQVSGPTTAAQTVQTQNMVALSASNNLFSSGTVVMTGTGGGITVNTSAGTIGLSVAAPAGRSFVFFMGG
jgi:hypothetical protein